MSRQATAATTADAAGQALLEELAYWGKDDYLKRLAAYPEPVRREVLRQAAAIWPVSYALGYNFLDQVDKGLDCLPLDKLSEWVNATLDVYEQEGLLAASRYLAEVESNFLCRLRGEHGLGLTAAGGRLLPYIRGLAGYELALAPAAHSWTDGETIFLPLEISLFKNSADNFTAYKLLASFQWGLLQTGTFSTDFTADFQARFPDPDLAADLFSLLTSHRVLLFLQGELPGLMRDSQPVRRRLQELRPRPGRLTGKARLLEAWCQWVLNGQLGEGLNTEERKLCRQGLALLAKAGASEAGEKVDGDHGEDVPALTAALYRLLEAVPGQYRRIEPGLGVLRPAAVQAVRQRRRQEREQRFVQALGAFLAPELQAEAAPEEGGGNEVEAAESPPPALATPESEGLAMLIAGRGEGGDEPDLALEPEQLEGPQYLVIGGREFELPQELRELAREISDDLGRVPQRYLSAAVGLAGSGAVRGPGLAVGGGEQEALAGPLVYDEWDYRRQGFRKNWCKLLPKELEPVQGTFVAATLAKYRGPLLQLRRQFEMMRLQQRFLKRQRDGDEIDFDAVVESLADTRAGVTPTEKLFIRLDRDERNIAAVFLVDMSSSTEGWISTALKEALALMCEALEVLGDRYAIYGFSGMRRQRSEFYHVKHLEERYDEQVKGRLAAINPREYTRMGPPIRHVTRLLTATEARVRLLITLSDGKPEDYDDYKGDYAIEDTRHALIEARTAGVHPFCITIDRQSHDYIPHMYGAVNYCFVDDVKRLPLRMPAIYRSLTT